MKVQHQNLASGQWFEMSLVEQLGNVGSEYERAWNWKEKQNQAYFEKASGRMLELFDLTLQDPRWKGLRLREIARAREQACEELYGAEAKKTMSKYFFQFAFAARN